MPFLSEASLRSLVVHAEGEMAKLLGDKGLNIVGSETKKKSDEQLLKLIAEGVGKMPASKLAKEEQKQALDYARSLAK